MSDYKDRMVDLAPKLIAALEAHGGVVLPAVAALVRAEKADALREAARFKEDHALDHDYWIELASRVYSPGKDMVTEWLRAEADRIESEARK